MQTREMGEERLRRSLNAGPVPLSCFTYNSSSVSVPVSVSASASATCRCVVLASSTITSGGGVAVVIRTGHDVAVFRLLQHLSSLSIFGVLLAPWY